MTLSTIVMVRSEEESSRSTSGSEGRVTPCVDSGIGRRAKEPERVYLGMDVVDPVGEKEAGSCGDCTVGQVVARPGCDC